MKPLVLGLGNDLLGDDAVGILAARELRRVTDGLAVIRETSLHGLALMDVMVGYDRIIILDSIVTGAYPAGAILTLRPEAFASVPGPSPHYSGLPEIMQLADTLGIRFPRDIVIMAVEILDYDTIGSVPSPPVQAAIPRLVRRVSRMLRYWQWVNGSVGEPVALEPLSP